MADRICVLCNARSYVVFDDEYNFPFVVIINYPECKMCEAWCSG